MKKNMSIVLLIALSITVCNSQSSTPRYTPGSKEYALFKILSDSLNIKGMDPDRSVDLITTNRFILRSNDIMPTLLGRLRPYKDQLSTFPPSRVKSLIFQTARQQAEEKLLMIEAERNHFTIPDSVFQKHLDNIYENYGGEESFTMQITSQGLTIDDVKDNLRKNLVIQNYLTDHVFNELSVEENEMMDFYNQDTQVTVRHILLMTQNKSEAEKIEIYKRMENILARARAGEDFEELAKQFTEDPGSKENGGLYENFSRGQMVKPFEEASFTVPVGSISNIVETKYGYHIIKVIERSGETRPYEEAKDEIYIKLLDTKKTQVYFLLIDSLKNEHNYQEHFSEVL